MGPTEVLERRLGVRLPFWETRPLEIMPEGVFPHYTSLVPKAFRANLEFRKRVLEWGSKSESHAISLWKMCQEDLLFWVNTFVWVCDPRLGDESVSPCITYPFQDGLLLELHRALGRYDLVIEKSRGMTASWSILIFMLWRHRFYPQQSFLLLSRKEDYVDKTNDLRALMPRLDFIDRYMPRWLLPSHRELGLADPNRTKLQFYNPDNGSLICGESTTSDMGRGGRFTAILGDEMASWPDGASAVAALATTSNTRIYNSTPKGAGNAFYELRTEAYEHRNDEVPPIRLVSLHWSLHPVYRQGLYVGGDGKIRSPWYDKQAAQMASTQKVAQELDIDYLASDYSFFGVDSVQKWMGEMATIPVHVGELLYSKANATPVEFSEQPDGPLRLWCALEESGRPPAGTQYVVGCDIALGSRDTEGRGHSYSAASVWDRRTKQKVAELTVHGLAPQAFAVLSVSLCRWFAGKDGDRGALLIWDRTGGPGSLFGEEVSRLGHKNIYRDGKANNHGGYWLSREAKKSLLEQYRYALASRTVINTSHGALAECMHYMMGANGDTIEHKDSRRSDDPSQARANHGDIVIADALASFALTNSKVSRSALPDEIPPDSLEARRRARALAERRHQLRDRWCTHRYGRISLH